MWSIYGGRGIALRSTFRAMGSAIRGEPVFAGVVQYVDYESGRFEDDGNVFTACLNKRAAFAYELNCAWLFKPHGRRCLTWKSSTSVTMDKSG